MSFLGPVGSLIPVKCASQLTSSGGREVSFARTLGKQKAFLGRVTAREWDVDIGLATPSELSGLRWLASYARGPLVWYGPDAVIGNVLDEPVAGLVPGFHNGVEGPMVEVQPETWVKAALPSTSALSLPFRSGVVDPVPVVAGQPVTISAWLRGNTLSGRQNLTVFWRNIDNTVISSQGVDFGVSPGFERRVATLIPPLSAAGFTIQFFAQQVAGPSVTLTDQLMPYSPGRGAKRVVAHGLQDAVIRAIENQQYQSLIFSLTEVG